MNSFKRHLFLIKDYSCPENFPQKPFRDVKTSFPCVSLKIEMKSLYDGVRALTARNNEALMRVRSCHSFIKLRSRLETENSIAAGKFSSLFRNFPSVSMKTQFSVHWSEGGRKSEEAHGNSIRSGLRGWARRCGGHQVNFETITCQPCSSRLRSTALSHMTASPAWKSRSLQHRSRRKMPKHFNNSEVEACEGREGREMGKV